MAVICPHCNKVHPRGAVLCTQVQKIFDEFQRKVEHHKQHCRGCPDPEQHVRILESMKSKEELRF